MLYCIALYCISFILFTLEISRGLEDLYGVMLC